MYPIIFLLSAALLVFGITFDLYLIVVCTAVVAVITSYFLWSQLDDVEDRVQEIREVQALQYNSEQLNFDSPGDRIHKILQTLEYRLNAVTEETERNEKSIEDPDQILLNDLNLATAEGVESFYEGVIDYILRNFRCANCAVLVERQDLKGDYIVFSARTRGRRFRKTLTHFINEARSDSQEPEGIYDSRDEKSFFSDLNTFGYQHSLLSSFYQSLSDQGSSRAFLWLGYAEGYPPLETEENRIKELSQQIETKLRSSTYVYELTGKLRTAEQQAKGKEDLLTQISHDIRSPLQNVRSILQVLRVDPNVDDSEEMIRIGLENCQGLRDLVEDLIDYARHRNGKLEANRVELNPDFLIADVCESYSMTAKLCGIELVHQRREGELLARVDRNHLRRITSNLISNALKYTPKGGEVSLSLKEEGKNLITLEVSDTGSGMSPEQLDRLFEPFSRFHTDQAEGTGLGLSFVKTLVEVNGGRIQYFSEKGKGTTARVSFPRVHDPEVSIPAFQSSVEQPIEEKKENILEIRKSDPLHVLLIDDDRAAIASLSRVLDTYGFTIAGAASLEEAEEYLGEIFFDAVILDHQIRETTGKEMLKEIEQQQHIPVRIVLSGINDFQLQADYDALGIHMFLEKPVDPESLARALRKLIEQNQSSKIPDQAVA